MNGVDTVQTGSSGVWRGCSDDITAPAEPLAGTVVGGTITTDTTWTLAGSPYRLETQNVTVSDNVTLTIEAGVTVEINAARNLWVNGTLLAVGTPTQPITFTRIAGATQPWGYLQIGGGSVVGDSDASRVSYATIEGGGSGRPPSFLGAKILHQRFGRASRNAGVGLR